MEHRGCGIVDVVCSARNNIWIQSRTVKRIRTILIRLNDDGGRGRTVANLGARQHPNPVLGILSQLVYDVFPRGIGILGNVDLGCLRVWSRVGDDEDLVDRVGQ